MVRARNTHASHIAGIPPEGTGEVSEDTLQAYPWALSPAGNDSADDPSEDPSEGLRAWEVKELIQGSDDPGYVSQFVGDGRSTVHNAAVRRLRALRKEEDGEG